ncbi:MAG: tetratricopeptide repeat protein [Cyanobacteria bacterium SZAS-4]|nr:tetratricopeptide repeat protein [Cyanobacteria bacterium SZAS-4]
METCNDALANIYLVQKRFDKAETLYKRVIEIREKKLGVDSIDLAEPLSGFAELRYKQKRFADSESLFLRALKIQIKELGQDHPDVVQTQSNLGSVYEDQGRFSEAEQLFNRVLQITAEKLGSTNLRVAAALNKLARLYLKQNRFTEAESAAQKCIEIRVAKLGPDDLSVAQSVNFLASVLEAQGRYADAELYDMRALNIMEKSRGVDSPDCADYLFGLARNYFLQGRYAEAEPLYKRTLAIYEKNVGSNQSGIALVCSDLAEIDRRQGEFVEAELLLKRAISIFEKGFGVESIEVAGCLNNLASLYWRQGKFDQSELLFIRAIGIHEKSTGLENANAANVMANLATLYSSMHAYDLAENISKRALTTTEKTVGANNPAVAIALDNLAQIYFAQARYNDAEPLFKRAVDIDEKVLGSDNLDLAMLKGDLACVYELQGRYAEAEPLFKSYLKTVDRTKTELHLGRGFRQKAVDMRANVTLFDSSKSSPSSKNSAPGDVNNQKVEVPQLLLAIKSAESTFGVNSPETGAAKLQLALFLVSIRGSGRPLFQDAFSLLKPLSEQLIYSDSLKTSGAHTDDDRARFAETIKKLGGKERAMRKLSAAMLCIAYSLSEYAIEERAKSAAQLSLALLKQASKNGATADDIDLLLSLAEYFESESQYASCKDALALALSHSRKLQNSPLRLKCMIAMAHVDMAEGDYANAAECAKQVLHETETQRGSSASFVEALDIAAACSEVSGHLKDAIGYSQRSLAVKDPSGNGTQSSLIPTLVTLGELHLAQRNYDLAKIQLDRASKIAEPLNRIGDRSIKAEVYSACGDLALASGNLDQALLCFNKAFSLSLLTGAKSVQFAHSLNSIARINALQNDYKAATVNALKSSYVLKHYLMTFVGQLSFAEQCAFANLLHDQTDLLLSVCTDGRSLPQAYGYIAQWKGLLIESLRKRTLLQKLAISTPEVQQSLDQLSALRRQLKILSDQDASGAEARKKRDDDIANLTQTSEALERQISLKSNGVEISDPMATKDCRELQKLLAADEAMVDIFAFNNPLTGKDEYDCIVLTQSAGPKLINLPNADAINDAIKIWRASANQTTLPKRDLSLDKVSNRQYGNYESKLKEEKIAQGELRKLLWDPIGSSLPTSIKKIWLCPDSDSAIIPWSMFTAGSQVQLCTIDSPREFVYLKETKKDNTQDPKLLVAAGITFGDPSLDLPGTRLEFDSIKDVAIKNKVAVDPLTGSEATEKAVAGALPSSTYAHFATHGFYSGASADEHHRSEVRSLRNKRQARGESTYLIEARNPLLISGLLLSGGKASDTTGEGKMTAADLVGLDLQKCNLVTLSACETGLGKKMSGQGVIGLRSAILGAGARGILMSLWKVDDAATCRLMKEFYTNLFSNHSSPVDSLRLAQEAVRKEPGWEHPFYWAGWVLAGDGWQ